MCYHKTMKTIEQSLTAEQTNHLNSFFEYPQDVLFFDIETTGFSPRSASIYLIGCAFYTQSGWRIRQYFADTPAQEAEIVKEFVSFSATFTDIVHFNGLTFDVPFLQAKCKRHAVSTFSPQNQCDIYKCISPYKNMLHLPGCRQRQLEEFIGIHREDPFTGGQLIELYRAYQENREERLLQVLLLHNAEDLSGMLRLYSIMSIPMLFEQGRFTIDQMYLQSLPDTGGVSRPEFRIRLNAGTALPVPISCHGADGILKQCFLSGKNRTILVKLPVWDGELKFFYPDYKNYAYLPEEDQAIHKSVAVYVDKSRRMPANASNCYTRKTGQFLPWFGEAPEHIPLFKHTNKDRQNWFLPDEQFWKDEKLQHLYIHHFLQKMMKYEKKCK
ncbi:MAG: ribonuclease H-like domain-containing protein [Eubacteriales bacterium]|nr:ribonuclease H-like domain-containing protein [Eubacteriales bacterium]